VELFASSLSNAVTGVTGGFTGAASPEVGLQLPRDAVKLRRERLVAAQLPRVVGAALGQVEQRARLARGSLRERPGRGGVGSGVAGF
jgi:hypothetical protein